MQISKFARGADVDANKIRQYEMQKLIPRLLSLDPDGPRYKQDIFLRQRVARRAAEFRLTSAKIVGSLDMSVGHHEDFAVLRQAAASRLQAQEARLAGLERLRSGLRRLAIFSPGRDASAICVVMTTLSED